MGKKEFFSKNRVWFGDLHNHCGISYGHGPLDVAYKNAMLQLDFASVTGHAAWPDIGDQKISPEVEAYHRRGFESLRNRWAYYLDVTEQFNEPGRFVTFFGYEIHSFRYGDRTVISPDGPPALPGDIGIEDFVRLLVETDARRDRKLLLPHHIGYKTGFRGIDWDYLRESASPLVEILSMHGLAEEEYTLFPYLHTMGPLDGGNTLAAGLAKGHRFGVVANTDHHSAHPGSFGYGKTGVWAPSLDREALWEAFLKHRTFALSGDRVILEFSCDGVPMGGSLPASGLPRAISVGVRANSPIERVDILRNGSVVCDRSPPPSSLDFSGFNQGTPEEGILTIEMGWGEKGKLFDWDFEVRFEGSELLEIEPRFRGKDIVDPLDSANGLFSLTSWQRIGSTGIHLSTKTFGNSTANTSQTQAMAFRLLGCSEDTVNILMNGRSISMTLKDLALESRVFYTGAFITPALRMHRFVPSKACNLTVDFEDMGSPAGGDVYYARVALKNGHGAWSSPIWVDGSKGAP